MAVSWAVTAVPWSLLCMGDTEDNPSLAMAGFASEGSLTLCAVRDICLELDLLLQTTFASEVRLCAQQFPLNRGTFPLPKLHA